MAQDIPYRRMKSQSQPGIQTGVEMKHGPRGSVFAYFLAEWQRYTEKVSSSNNKATG